LFFLFFSDASFVQNPKPKKKLRRESMVEPAGLFAFYHAQTGATWEWRVPQGWAHAGWGGSNNAQYPREELFVGPHGTLDEAERSLDATLAEQLALGAITRYAVERTYTDTPGRLRTSARPRCACCRL
jgi:hypothetical protein